MPLLTILDGTASGNVPHGLELVISQETLTVPDKAAACNERQPGGFRRPGPPTKLEAVPNGYRPRPHRLIDAEFQAPHTLEVFQQDGFFRLVPDSSTKSLGHSAVFLPFGGDAVLSGSLSKTRLLLDDDKITDTTILRQL
jgi:hypothetical protein